MNITTPTLTSVSTPKWPGLRIRQNTEQTLFLVGCPSQRLKRGSGGIGDVGTGAYVSLPVILYYRPREITGIFSSFFAGNNKWLHDT